VGGYVGTSSISLFPKKQTYYHCCNSERIIGETHQGKRKFLKGTPVQAPTDTRDYSCFKARNHFLVLETQALELFCGLGRRIKPGICFLQAFTTASVMVDTVCKIKYFKLPDFKYVNQVCIWEKKPVLCVSHAQTSMSFKNGV
jgi:hypothetical protein